MTTKTIKFKPDNGIRVFQDMCQFFYKNIPHDIEFEVEEAFGRYWLSGDGYGNLKERNKYGNGKLFVYPKDNPKLETLMGVSKND